MALTDAQNLSYLRDPLETEEDDVEMVAMMAASRAIGHPGPYTAAEEERMHEMVAAAMKQWRAEHLTPAEQARREEMVKAWLARQAQK